MTALANRLFEIAGSIRNFADVADQCVITEVVNSIPAMRVWADELDELRAALSPAELGGVEAVAWQYRYAGTLPNGGSASWQWCSREEYERYKATAYQCGYDVRPLYTTPRAAEAVSVADIGLCNWAAHILSDPERFNTRANDASAAIRRLVAALTPPSAKGE